MAAAGAQTRQNRPLPSALVTTPLSTVRPSIDWNSLNGGMPSKESAAADERLERYVSSPKIAETRRSYQRAPKYKPGSEADGSCRHSRNFPATSIRFRRHESRGRRERREAVAAESRRRTPACYWFVGAVTRPTEMSEAAFLMGTAPRSSGVRRPASSRSRRPGVADGPLDRADHGQATSVQVMELLNTV
jgi:hypothetical protein